MTRLDYARRKLRGGRKQLPPNPKQWEYEHHALDLREDLGLEDRDRLSTRRAFALLPRTLVIPHGEIPAADMYLNHFRGAGSPRWSGLAISLPDGSSYVVFNDSHPPTRTRSTLMEEYFHLRLGHPHSIVRVLACADGLRTYNDAYEEEAFASGAAALVPYCGLRSLVAEQKNPRAIAGVYGVSEDLVRYRLKVTRLYRKAVR